MPYPTFVDFMNGFLGHCRYAGVVSVPSFSDDTWHEFLYRTKLNYKKQFPLSVFGVELLGKFNWEERSPESQALINCRWVLNSFYFKYMSDFRIILARLDLCIPEIYHESLIFGICEIAYEQATLLQNFLKWHH